MMLYNEMPPEEMDPSSFDGFEVIYDCEVPMEIRSQTGDLKSNEGSSELIKVKLATLGKDVTAPRAVRMELSSEADLFFHYTHCINTESYMVMREGQGLLVEFPDYAQHVLCRMLTSCLNEPQSYLAVFTMLSATEGRLDFFQNLEYKMVETLRVVCQRTGEASIQAHIAYRYNSIKKQMLLAQNQLVEVTNVVKNKNPSLLLNLQRHFHREPTGRQLTVAESLSSGGSYVSTPTRCLAAGSVATSSVFAKGDGCPDHCASNNSREYSYYSPTASQRTRSDKYEFVTTDTGGKNNNDGVLHPSSSVFSLNHLSPTYL